MIDPIPALGRLNNSISPRFGIVRGFAKRLSEPGGTNLDLVGSITGQFEFIGGHSLFSAGGALSSENALGPCLGEALERYAFGFVHQLECHPSTSWHELSRRGLAALAPEKCNLYSPAQYEQRDFQFSPYRADLPLTWIQGYNLLDSSKILAPIDYVRSSRPAIFLANTTGLGSGPNQDRAILSGLLEVIERDHFCFAWWTKSPFPKLAKNTMPDDLQHELESHFGHLWPKISVGINTLDLGVPVAIAVFRGTTAHEPALAVAAAAHLDPVRAVKKSLIELGLCLAFTDDQMRRGLPSFTGDFDREINDFLDGVNYYAKHGRDHHRDILIDNQHTISLADITDRSTPSAREDIQAILKSMQNLNLTPLAFDLTTQDVRSCGHHVFKVIIPDMIQMTASHRYHLGGSRMENLFHAFLRRSGRAVV